MTMILPSLIAYRTEIDIKIQSNLCKNAEHCDTVFVFQGCINIFVLFVEMNEVNLRIIMFTYK